MVSWDDVKNFYNNTKDDIDTDLNNVLDGVANFDFTAVPLVGGLLIGIKDLILFFWHGTLSLFTLFMDIFSWVAFIISDPFFAIIFYEFFVFAFAMSQKNDMDMLERIFKGQLMLIDIIIKILVAFITIVNYCVSMVKVW